MAELKGNDEKVDGENNGKRKLSESSTGSPDELKKKSFKDMNKIIDSESNEFETSTDIASHQLSVSA